MRRAGFMDLLEQMPEEEPHIGTCYRLLDLVGVCMQSLSHLKYAPRSGPFRAPTEIPQILDMRIPSVAFCSFLYTRCAVKYVLVFAKVSGASTETRSIRALA
jgi:hypothetical protein